MTRELFFSDEQATAVDPDSDPDVIAARRAALDESNRLIAEDKMKPRFTGELGDHFFILDRTAPFPTEYDLPPALRGTCHEGTVTVTAAGTGLYIELPTRIDDTDIALSGPPQGQLCAAQFVSVEQHGTIDTIFGPASASVQATRASLFHDRAPLYFDAPRDRFELTSIAGKPALVILPVGPLNFAHVHVIEQVTTAGQPGVITSVGAELPTEQVVKLAEEVLRTSR